MEASIKEPNIKNFVRFLQCAAKFGDDLNMHANEKVWELSVTNSSKSAFCLFKLRPGRRNPQTGQYEDGFFSRYKALGETGVQRRKGVKCQLLVKSVLAVLAKSSSAGTVERLDLKIVDPEENLRARRRARRTQSDSVEVRHGRAGQDGDGENGYTDDDEEEALRDVDDEGLGGRGAKLLVKLVCRHGVTKKHALHLAPSPFLRATVDPRSTPSGFSLPARTLRDWLDHFSAFSSTGSSSYSSASSSNPVGGENQLGWMFTDDRIRIRSFELGNRDLSTEVVVDAREFDLGVGHEGQRNYEIVGGRVELMVPMREFRATLLLAEQLAITLTVSFSTPTQPLTLTSDPEEILEDSFSIFCAIATTSCDVFRDVPPEIKPKRSDSSSFRGSAESIKRNSSDMTSPEGDLNGHSAGRKRKAGSEVPQASGSRRPRSSLAFSEHEERPAVVVNSVPTSAVVGPGDDQEEAEEEEGQGLFLPGASQVDKGKNKVTLSQAEVMELSGFDIRPEDLMEELDDAEEEDEKEELRASQAPRAQEEEGRVEKENKNKGKSRVEPESDTKNEESRLFEPDTTIDWDAAVPLESGVMSDLKEVGGGTGGGEGLVGAEDKYDRDAKGEEEGKDDGVARGGSINEENDGDAVQGEGDGDESMELPPTQRMGSFPSFFGDDAEVDDDGIDDDEGR